jgi:small subunit ribosomal protein S14
MKRMARLAMRVKEIKRTALVKKYEAKRKSLKALVIDPNISEDERLDARLKLTKLPKNSCSTRQRNRCGTTGRTRGYMSKFNLCRNEFRRLANWGLIPGVTKSSW